MGRHHKTEHPDDDVPADTNGRFDVITDQTGWHTKPTPRQDVWHTYQPMFRGLDATTELPTIGEPLAADRKPIVLDEDEPDNPKTYSRETLIFTAVITAILTAGTSFITFYAIAADAGLCQ
jgi:hypothetical protein